MRRSREVLWTAGLVALGVVTVVLAALALMRPGQVPANPPAPRPSLATGGSISPSAIGQRAGSVSASAADTRTVVVVGDRLSLNTDPGAWVNRIDVPGWRVVNLSVAGRGYLTLPPKGCGLEICGTFEQTVPLVVAAEPDVVITFGGTADGDIDIAGAAMDYYKALREALPSAELISISPVTTSTTAPSWLMAHHRSIKAGVEAAHGYLIDVGQPSLGSGRSLSSSAQQLVAERVNARLAAKE